MEVNKGCPAKPRILGVVWFTAPMSFFKKYKEFKPEGSDPSLNASVISKTSDIDETATNLHGTGKGILQILSLFGTV